jgi:hypothetical protein
MLRKRGFIRACYSIFNYDFNKQIRQVNVPHRAYLYSLGLRLPAAPLRPDGDQPHQECLVQRYQGALLQTQDA